MTLSPTRSSPWAVRPPWSIYDEGEALVAGGSAIYLNMGTLFPIYEQTIPRAAKAAHDAGKPWVLDPVGLGIGSLRTSW